VIAGYAEGTGPLTPAMRAALELKAQGRTVPEIARELDRSHGTVRTELRAAYVRLGARNDCEAVAVAIRSGELR